MKRVCEQEGVIVSVVGDDLSPAVCLTNLSGQLN